MPHIIRLRGPWEFDVLRQTAGPPVDAPTGRVQMPCDWSATLGKDFRGTVRYRRFFNWTAPLNDQTKVTLAIDGAAQSTTATLNGHSLGSFGPGPSWRSIEHFLLPRNELIVDVDSPNDGASPGGLSGEVRLEIE